MKYLIIFIVLMLWSCQNEPKSITATKGIENPISYSIANQEELDTVSNQVITFVTDNKKHSADEIFFQTQVIPLETKKESLIAEERKLVYHDGKIYIYGIGE